MAERSRWLKEPFTIDDQALRRLQTLLSECLVEIDAQIRAHAKEKYEKLLSEIHVDGRQKAIQDEVDTASTYNRVNYSIVLPDGTKLDFSSVNDLLVFMDQHAAIINKMT